MTIEELKERAEGGKRAAERKALDATRLRDRANSLFAYEPFVDWLGDLMASVGYFGRGASLRPTSRVAGVGLFRRWRSSASSRTTERISWRGSSRRRYWPSQNKARKGKRT